MFPAVRTMLLISHSSRLTRFHLHWLNFFHKLLCLSPSRILTSFILKKFVYWRKSEVKVSWSVYEFYELFDADLFLRLYVLWWNCYLDFLGLKRAGSFQTWRCLWDLSIQNRISRLQTTKRLLCGKLQWWTLHRDGHIFVRTFSVGLKTFCYGWGKGVGERSREILQRKL